MRCHNARILMTKRLYEPLSAGEGSRLQRHLVRCPSCQAEQEEMGRFEGELRRIQAQSAAPSVPPVEVDVAAILNREGLCRPRRSRWMLRLALGAAAAAALAGFMLRRPGRTTIVLDPRICDPRGHASHGSPRPPWKPGRGGLSVHHSPSPPRRLPLAGRPGGSLRIAMHSPATAGAPSPTPVLFVPRSDGPLHARPAPRPDADERYLDGRDPQLAEQWLAGNDRDRRSLERLLRRLPAMRDDFVQGPFPQLAVVDPKGALAARAVAQYEKEAKVIDVRLFQHVTLQEKAVSLGDLCAALERQTKVKIQAARGVADDKVTVFVEGKSARGVMRAVARLFGCFWTRSGQEGAYRYELAQDLRSQLAEQEMRNRDLDAGLVALDEQMSVYQPYLELDPEQVAERARRATGPEKERLDRVAGPRWGGLQLYHHLTPLERAALAGGEPLQFSSDSSRPDRRLPDAWRLPLLRAWGDWAMAWSEPDHNLVAGSFESLREHGLSPTRLLDWPGASINVSLRINRSELGELSLEATSGYVMPYKDRTPGAGQSVTLATAQSPSVARPENAAANQSLRGDPAFTRQVSLHPQPSCPWFAPVKARQRGQEPPEEEPLWSAASGRAFTAEGWERRARLQTPHVSTADVWEAVHRETGMPIVADAYTHLFPAASVQVERTTLFEALCRVADQMHARWHKDGDFLLCRSTSFFWDRLKEVPNRYLTRWQEDKHQQGGLPFADLLEMASLSDYQLDSRTVGEGISHCWRLNEWDLLGKPAGGYSPLPWLRLLAGLPLEQQRETLTPEGLRVGNLTRAEQQAVLAAMGPRIVSDDPAKTLEDAASWRIRIGYAPAGWYAWVPVLTPLGGRDAREQAESRPVLAARTAGAVLTAARKIDPKATAEQIERTGGVLSMTLLFPNGRAWTVAGERPVRFQPVP